MSNAAVAVELVLHEYQGSRRRCRMFEYCRRARIGLPRRPLAAVAACVLAAIGTACSSSSTTPTTTVPTGAAHTAAADGAAPARTDVAGVEWLCRPGLADNPCTAGLTSTVVPESGPTTVEHSSPAANPRVDCFYVYPTVSQQSGVVANLHIDPSETAVARAQASRFSQVCQVYAPVYRQLTLHALADPGAVTAADLVGAYQSVQAAWEDYLAHYNRGRGVILIGHSQGASMLIKLLQKQVDNNPTVRKRLVSAIILGGNVTVPVGKTVGGSFQHIPACTTTLQTGCVIAYSSFDQAPPANSLFGRPGTGVSALSGDTSSVGLQVLCVNPADPSGGIAPLTPYFPTKSSAKGLGGLSGLVPPALPTPWVTEPDLYSGQCLSQGGATWLQVSAPIHAGDPRTIVGETLGPTWGLHLVDVNIALGNLIALTRSEVAAYDG
jgi:Protein of unknown function (DUF3089)